jgi:hypothetical protein
MSRIATITERLSLHCWNDLNIHCGVIPKNDWLSLHMAMVYRFGWTPPVDLAALDVDDSFIAFISPEMIASVTEHLDDADFDTYLTVVEVCFDAYVHHRGLPTEEIDRRIEDVLWDSAPDALRLRGEVEAHAIDVGIVPRVGVSGSEGGFN